MTLPNAPIAVFAFSRPAALGRALASLAQCPEFVQSELFIFVDGPRREEDIAAVEQTRNIAKAFVHPRKHLLIRNENVGLGSSIIDGVTRLTEDLGSVIVLEDDLTVSSNFLAYMNAALDRYVDEDLVKQVGGFMFRCPPLAARHQAGLFPFITSWGWATWRRAWQQFDPVCCGAAEYLRAADHRNRFNCPGIFDWATMMEQQLAGRSDSWAIRWYWSVFSQGGLAVFPATSVVFNHGLDGSGSHGSRLYRYVLRQEPLYGDTVPMLPSEIGPSLDQLDLLEKFYRKGMRGSLLRSRKLLRDVLRL